MASVTWPDGAARISLTGLEGPHPLTGEIVPIADADVEAVITARGEEPVTIPLEPVAGSPGDYSVVTAELGVPPRTRVTAVVTAMMGGSTSTWQVDAIVLRPPT